MLPKNVLAMSTSHVGAGEGIPVSTKFHGLEVLGSSVPMSMKPPSEECQGFIIYPDKPGVVALMVTDRNPSRPLVQHGLFLGVEADADGKFFIVDDKMWIPPHGRIGQMYDHSRIDVLINGVVYLWGKHYAERDGDYAYVADPNLLCRYLAGDVDAEAVKAAAVEHEQESSARETIKRIKDVLGVTFSNEAIVNFIAEYHKGYTKLGEKERQIYQPLVRYLEGFGLFASFGGVRPEYFADDCEKRIGSATDLLCSVRLAYNDRGLIGRIFLRHRIRKAYEAYKAAAQETAHFAPDKL